MTDKYIRCIEYNGRKITDMRLVSGDGFVFIQVDCHVISDNSILIVDGKHYKFVELFRYLKNKKSEIYNLCYYKENLIQVDRSIPSSFREHIVVHIPTDLDLKFRSSLTFRGMPVSGKVLKIQPRDVCDIFLIFENDVVKTWLEYYSSYLDGQNVDVYIDIYNLNILISDSNLFEKCLVKYKMIKGC